MLHISSGIVPVKRVRDMSSVSTACNRPIDDGIDPSITSVILTLIISVLVHTQAKGQSSSEALLLMMELITATCSLRVASATLKTSRIIISDVVILLAGERFTLAFW